MACLPDALGAKEVQAAEIIQESPEVVARLTARQPGMFAHWAWMNEF